MGCISSVPPEGYLQRNIDSKRKQSKKSKKNNQNKQNNQSIENKEKCHDYNGNNSNYFNQYIVEEEQEGIVDTDIHKMGIFINKYKLDQLSSSIYNERITVDFLLSQNDENIIAIAKHLSNNMIQQEKFIYAVKTEKAEKKENHHNHNHNYHHNERKERKQDEDNRQIRIFIKSPDIDNNRSLPLFVSDTDTISNVLNAYHQKYKYSALNTQNHEMQTLMYCGTQMMETKDLSFYGVLPNDELCIIYKQKEIINNFNNHKLKKVKKAKKIKTKKSSNKHKDIINIFIKTQRNKICVMSMMVLQTAKIKWLKLKIQKKWGISSENQRLNYNNQELNDNDNINDYNISHNDTIYMTKLIGLYSVFINIKSHIHNNKSITIGVEKK